MDARTRKAVRTIYSRRWGLLYCSNAQRNHENGVARELPITKASIGAYVGSVDAGDQMLETCYVD